MSTGKIKNYNDDRGFGFIVPDDGSADMFFHVTALDEADIDEVPMGLALSYDIAANPKNGREKAVNLRRMTKP